jgi:NAD(P)-dependent dehydrogenase (short-subunit alcohol dehydrogenase family)
MILANKVVLITGVGPGMGCKLGLEAAKAGAKVVLTARSKPFIDEVSERVKRAGGEALAVKLDVTKQHECQAAVDAALKAFGRIDGLINSAYHPGHWVPIEDDDIEFWKESMDVSVYGALRMIKAVVPPMKAQGGGAIVNICSMESRKPLAYHGSYTVPKGALQAVTRQMAIDLIQYKIRVNSAVIGWMWGAPVEQYFVAHSRETGEPLRDLIAARSAQIPIGHIPPDQECAKAALLLLSDYCSQMVGAGLDINGGEWLSL